MDSIFRTPGVSLHGLPTSTQNWLRSTRLFNFELLLNGIDRDIPTTRQRVKRLRDQMTDEDVEDALDALSEFCVFVARLEGGASMLTWLYSSKVMRIDGSDGVERVFTSFVSQAPEQETTRYSLAFVAFLAMKPIQKLVDNPTPHFMEVIIEVVEPWMLEKLWSAATPNWRFGFGTFTSAVEFNKSGEVAAFVFLHRDDTGEGWDLGAVLDETHSKPCGWGHLIASLFPLMRSHHKIVDAILARVDHGDVDSLRDIFERVEVCSDLWVRRIWGHDVFKRACRNSDLETVEAIFGFVPSSAFDWTAGPMHPLVLALTAGMPGGCDKLSSTFKRRRSAGISAELVLLLCDKPGAAGSVTLEMLEACQFPWFWDESGDMVDARSRAMCALARLVLMSSPAPNVELMSRLKVAIFSKLAITCAKEETPEESELALPSLFVAMGQAPGLEHEVQNMVVYYTSCQSVNKALLPFLKRTMVRPT